VKNILKGAILTVLFSYVMFSIQPVLAQDIPNNVPNTTVPDTVVPNTTTPGTTVPDTTVPNTTVPDTTIPDTTVPENNVVNTTNDNDWGKILIYGGIGAIIGGFITYLAVHDRKIT
jgi:hypothetical protein